ncbi:hypothetical protein PF005_g5808 [Phytophthora fragariae]|uniref:RxLR effector protein n=1 Tax=Phytophthora fragariae TaxID=53985 RepID=A0A6A3YTZ9_9STRA|nr:hypothetical protein PF003_g694 [Phytophthora fragariae]KAE8915414.1 hypothetical protein PF003_g692 [Phytophthora fragariae]KAE8974445.1 hypothetical protein PF011_g24861 [Phytophthora fragariae]KAE9072982.1 hypothetical protein PF007_g25980 [Phytophthora fragariae]KAE9150496.1 hypothetical protein PF006_g5137 [Phytophthora fragariae]
MRACYVLLVAATSLLAASDAAISAASVQSTLSKVVAPDVAQPIQAEQAAASSTLRFLRSHNILDDDEEDVDSLEDVYEERGKPPPSPRRGWTKRWTTSASWASFASNGMTTATV